MAANAVYGVGTGINGRDAAMQAAQQALDHLGAVRAVLCLVFAAQEFDLNEVLAGLTSLLGETPLWGFSTLRPLTSSGEHARSVVVALIAGAELKAEVIWLPNFAQDSSGTARQLMQTLRQKVFMPQDVLLAADGINGSLEPICAALAEMPVAVDGGLACGDLALGKTFTMGAHQAGAGALAAAVLGGTLRVGRGLGHGWQDLGIYFHVTRAKDVWVETLDELSAVDAYARPFGYPARDWSYPPLAEMTRLYPLGVEQHTGKTGPFVEVDPSNLVLRSVLRAGVDGVLRMSAPVPEGAVAHLMTGDADACLIAAQDAVKTAQASLSAASSNARPLLAIALVDMGWDLLFEPRAGTGALVGALQSALGDVPLVGAYTFGQLARPDLQAAPIVHNQNIAVLLLGEEG